MTSTISPEHWRARAGLGASLLAAMLVVPALYAWADGTPSTREKVLTLFINVILAVGLQVFTGNSGLLSFGHMAFVGVGAYAASVLTLDPALKLTYSGFPHLPFLPATVIAACVAGVVALFTGVLILRLTGPSAVIAIFSLVLISNVVFSAWTQVTRGSGGLYGVPREATVGSGLVFAIIAVVVARYVRESSAGLQLQAAREDEVAAASVGVRIRALRLRAWVASAMISAVGGSLIAHDLTAFSPNNFFLTPTFLIIAMLVVGGMRTVSGAVVGALLVTAAQNLVRPAESIAISFGPLKLDRLTGLTQLTLVLMILAVMYFRREGLLGRRELDEALGLMVRHFREPGPRLREAFSSDDSSPTEGKTDSTNPLGPTGIEASSGERSRGARPTDDDVN